MATMKNVHGFQVIRREMVAVSEQLSKDGRNLEPR
jgi:hypothetical protein